MMVWLEGGLNPNEIKDRVLQNDEYDFKERLLRYLEDTISTCIPEYPQEEPVLPQEGAHPCSTRGVNFRKVRDDLLQTMREKDIHSLAKKCQTHRHSKTCWKYWRGPPEPKECRFDLDEKNVHPISFTDPETGEITLKCLDGLVNHFNTTILEAVRCNMDIKFIGSGPAAKAILYYITDYITKSQLKTHVALAAMETAIHKLEVYNPNDDECTVRGKRLLQKCAHSMISHQELSAQQVCSYLLDFEDHFTSHEYRKLYWTNFESFVEQCNPSPECNRSSSEIDTMKTNDNPENDRNDILETADEDLDLPEKPVETVLDDQEIYVEQLQNDEIRIDSDNFGNLVPKAAQVMDYLHRDEKFNNICVWDFVAQVDKVKKKKKKNKSKPDNVDSDDEEDDDDIDHSLWCEDELDETIVDNESNENVNTERPPETRKDAPQLEELLQFSSKERPFGELQAGHYESRTHFLQVRRHRNRLIPVPMGPRMPRRDQQAVYPKYCRLMLILFKPWRSVSDLKKGTQSWTEVFDEFRHTCSPAITYILNNMQILHECKDSRDDHFANRRLRHKLAGISTEIISQSHCPHEDDIFTDDTDNDILTHLESMDSCRSIHQSTTNDDLICCLHHMDSCRFFDALSHAPYVDDPADNGEDNSEVNVQDILEENNWRDCYEKRRTKWKKKQVVEDPIEPASSGNKNKRLTTIEMFGAKPFDTHGTLLPDIQCHTHAIDPYCDINSARVAEDWTLNDEQSRAFKIIAEHSRLNNPEPLRMFIGGPAGTGKSRVINALKDFFIRRNQRRRFRLASYMGVAARNISGMTLHASLLLNQRRSSGANTQMKRDLTAMWEGIDYLFIDEVSMISCDFLTKIHNALVDAKGNTAPFGGINIIFAGDFAQLSPVSGKQLYAHIDTRRCGTTQGQKNIFGRLLWLSVKTVVLLRTIMRQSGTENERFVDFLSRLRQGKCTQDDYRLLQSRVITNGIRHEGDCDWKDAPIIVCDNESKDELNIRMTMAFAQRTGRTLHWYHCTDKHQGKILRDEALVKKLQHLNSGKTNMRLGKIPLVIGMPILVSQNFDVEGGIVNGSTGKLRKVRYSFNNEGQRILRSCIVEISHSSDEALPNLSPHQIPIIEDSVELRFTHPNCKKTCRITRTQVPVLPGFVITAHKSQGQTLEKIIVDLGSKWCRGTEKPYVMVSRVTSLQNLFVLRPFNYSVICSHPSQDVRQEMLRLDMLNLNTIIHTPYATEDQQQQAQNQLPSLSMPITEDEPCSQEHQANKLDNLQQGIDLIQSTAGTQSGTTQPPSRRKKRKHADQAPTSCSTGDNPLPQPAQVCPRRTKRRRTS
jgi:hypothetical protein